MKKFLWLFLLLMFPSIIFAQEEVVPRLYFFRAQGCPHCEAEEAFLKSIAEETSFEIFEYEITQNPSHLKLLQDLATYLKIPISGTPFTIVGTTTLSGFQNEETSGNILREAIERIHQGLEKEPLKDLILKGDGGTSLLKKSEIDLSNLFVSQTAQESCSLDSDTCTKPAKNETKPDRIFHIPLWGAVDLKGASLLTFSVVLGLLDGFNPCAMWVLIFLIGLLLGLGDRRRMWILGGLFILTSAGIYFLIMTAWLNVLVFLGWIFWVRLGIGLLALVGGGWYLYDAYSNTQGVCKISGGANRQKIFQRLKAFAQHPNLFIAGGGIMILAFAVNVVEMVCSAGLPVIFNETLIMAQISSWKHYEYLLIYILFFMLDDLVVFSIAMFTLRYTNLSTKYSRFSHLIGGIVMVMLGLLLIFKPEWLMFG